MISQCYSNNNAAHRRFEQRCQNDVLRESAQIDGSECFIEATVDWAKGSQERIEPIRSGKGVKSMAIVNRHGLPLAVCTNPANHHEATLVQLTVDSYTIDAKRDNPIGDRVYDSNELDDELRSDPLTGSHTENAAASRSEGIEIIQLH